LTVLSPRPYSDRSAIDVLDRIDRIQDQIEQHLLDLHRAALNDWQIPGQRSSQPHPVLLHALPHKRQHVADECVDVDVAPLGRRLPAELTRPANDGTRTVGVGHDVGQRLADLGDVSGALIEPANAGVGVRGDGGKRLIDFVRD
jgi:hypothetical protein